MTVESDQFLLVEFDWSAQTELYLLEAMIGLKPIGVNKHFEMATICDKFVDLFGADVEPDVLWKQLGRMYNIPLIEENNTETLQPGILEYNLPDPEYTDLLTKKIECKVEPALEEPIDDILHAVQKVVKDYSRNKDQKKEVVKKETKKIVSRKNSSSSDTTIKKEEIKTDTGRKDVKRELLKKKLPAKADSEIIALGQKDEPLPSSRSGSKMGIKRTLKRSLRSRADEDASNAPTPPPNKRPRRI